MQLFLLPTLFKRCCNLNKSFERNRFAGSRLCADFSTGRRQVRCGTGFERFDMIMQWTFNLLCGTRAQQRNVATEAETRCKCFDEHESA